LSARDLIRRVYARFTPSHRGGSGPPVVCLHGFGDTWQAWELVHPMLEQRHDVLALTLAAHRGGPPLAGEASDAVLTDTSSRRGRGGLRDGEHRRQLAQRLPPLQH
jgi:pimeloyl-ACP methyl ester carboxylesterase